MKYLIDTTETYRVETEAEVNSMINEAKTNPTFTLVRYKCEAKDVKVKGEVVDTYYKVSFTKRFNDIKDPEIDFEIIYEEN